MEIVNNEDFLLFFSADIIDSTRMKYKCLAREKDNEAKKISWMKKNISFYIKFQEKLNEQCATLTIYMNKGRSQTEKITIPLVHLWKTNGDEMLFFVSIIEAFKKTKEIYNRKKNDKIIKHRYDIVICYIKVFKQAIEEFNKDKENVKNSIEIKGTVWVADFPINNRKIPPEINLINKQQYDFIGKSIDIGFRLSKYSALGKIVISIELARILLRDIKKLKEKGEDINLNIGYNDINLYFDDEVELKGVWYGRKYPIIWMAVSDVPTNEHHKLKIELSHSQMQNKKKFQEYLQKFFGILENQFPEPYIPGPNNDVLFSTPPENYAHNCDNANKEIEELSKNAMEFRKKIKKQDMQ